MKRALPALPLVLILGACSSQFGGLPLPTITQAGSSPVTVSPVAGTLEVSPSPSDQPSPSPEARATPAYGVLVDLLTSSTTYIASLVGVDGSVAASVTAARRTPIATPAGHAIPLPYVSTSLTALYYLDGDSIVELLRPDGSQSAVANFNLGAGMEAAFAVSPDDNRIAVSVLDFNQSPVHVTLYTNTLNSSSGRHVIFQSTTDYVWPVAWHAGLLVLAHAYDPYLEDIGKAAPGIDNPYAAISYHVVDPFTGSRQVLMGSCTVSGPLSPAGSGCIQGGTIDWTGQTTNWSANDWGSISSAAAVSPDGQWVAATRPGNLDEMAIWRRDGTVANYANGPGTGDWAGWVDDQDLMVGSYIDPNWRPTVENVIRGGYVFTIAARGFYAARLPTDVV